MNLSLGKVVNVQKRFLARTHRDLLLNWGQVHFGAANKGTTICHEKKKCTYVPSTTYRRVSVTMQLDPVYHFAPCLQLWFCQFLERIGWWDIGLCYISIVSSQMFENILALTFGSFATAPIYHTLHLLQFELHFGLLSPLFAADYLPPLNSQKSSIFPRLPRWRLQLPNFCKHTSLQIFVPYIDFSKKNQRPPGPPRPPKKLNAMSKNYSQIELVLMVWLEAVW